MVKKAYRLTVLDAYHAELKRTRHVVICRSGRQYIKNTKRSNRLKAHLSKLNRYMSIAWAGYSFGKVVRKVTCEECEGRGEIFMGMDPGGMWQPPEAIVERCEACEGKGYHEQ